MLRPDAKDTPTKAPSIPGFESGLLGKFLVAGAAAAAAGILIHRQGQVVIDKDQPGWNPLKIFHDTRVSTRRQENLSRMAAFLIVSGGIVDAGDMKQYIGGLPDRGDRMAANWALRTLQKEGVELVGTIPRGRSEVTFIASEGLMAMAADHAQFPLVAGEIHAMQHPAEDFASLADDANDNY